MSSPDRRRFLVLLAVIFVGSPLLPILRQQLPPAHTLPEHWQWVYRLQFDSLAIILPSMSPFLVVGGLIAGYAVGWWSTLAVVTLVLGLLRGRWFCRNICPVGWLNDRVCGWNRQGAQRLKRFPNLGPWVAMIGIGGAVVGYPFFFWLDPLSLFNGFLNVWRIPFSAAAWGFALGLPSMLVLSLVFPGSWCYRLCPLGATQEQLGRLGRWWRRRHRREQLATGATELEGLRRRDFLALGCGIVAGGLARTAGRFQPFERSPMIRPPGAVSENRFKALCARCGNCMRACPQRIIHPAGAETGWDGLLTPVLRIKPGYCAEFCNACNLVCPTLAIRRLSLEQKQKVAIGIARIDRSTCIAWAQGKYCMVCDEYCPYKAIHSEEQRGVPTPVVLEDRCRGCGLCQTVCPGKGPAIRVVGIQPQRRLAA
ncbi:MAG: 4Fe-4S dicluster domain-containing protein [Kiritimatiellia bacterium]